MNKNRFLLSFIYISMLLLISAGLSPAQSQNRRGEQPMELGLPKFHLDAITFLSDDPTKTQVVVYVQIMYDNLHFVRTNRGYEASYEVDFSVLTGDNDSSPRYQNKLWRSDVLALDYEETNSRERFDVSETTMDLPPGTYYVVATLTDLETKMVSEAKSKLIIPSYSEPGLQLGDLIIAKQVRLAADGNFEIVPNVDRVVRNMVSPVYVYYEIYPHTAQSLDIYYRVLNEEGAIVYENSLIRTPDYPITRDYALIETEDLTPGYFAIEMQISSEDETVLKGAHFRIKMPGVPSSISDLDEAINQLRYIATRRKVKDILNARGRLKEVLFREFWEKRDPTPESSRNELMEEYYWRIEQCNEFFGGFRPGWETERGEVYVRFGPPSEIERHPFSMNSKPYEIWYYDTIQRQFLFVDELGFGEYRLVGPMW